MTMSAVLGELARHQERYVRSWGIVEQILKFKQTNDPADLPDFPDVPRDVVTLLLKSEGQKELDRWIAAFERSIKLMQQFNVERNIGVTFNVSDWRLMDESAASALELLKDSIRKLRSAE